MRSISQFLHFSAAAIVVVMLHSPAEAFWGFGTGREGAASGLDLVQGYDRNTVTTLTGRVVVSPDPSSDPVTVEINAGYERYTVVLGPRWYLQDDNLDWNAGDTVTVRGSKAQGKDGRTYLLAQRISASGGNMILRNEAGRPGWSGGFRGRQQYNGGQQQRGSGGSHRGR